MRLQSLALLMFTVFAPVAAAQSFQDDAETGTVTTDETPPGRWDFEDAAPNCSITSSTAAAHRGSRGLRVVDASGLMGPQAYAGFVLLPPVAGAYHLRFWFRGTSSNAQGNAYIASLTTSRHDLVSMEIDNTSGRVKVGGFSGAGPSWIGRPTTTPYNITDSNWRLVELAARGVGTANGTRELRIDGISLDVMTGIDWTDWTVEAINLGEFWASPGSFQGVLDFDDVRGELQSHASTLTVAAPLPVPANECVPVTVGLKSSSGQSRHAPYAFDAALTLDGASGMFFVDAACQTATTRIALAKGASTATVYLKAGLQGDAAISASYVDFLQGSATVTITPPVVVDAGTDAGIEEDAGTQPEPDAGESDAGEPDAGVPDGGMLLDAPLAVVVPEEVTVTAGELVELDASGSVAPPGASIADFRWELVEGPTFLEATGHERVIVTPREPGTYVFRLVVSDSLGRPSLPASARITVGGDVSPPEARLGGCGCTSNGSVLPLAAFGWILVSALRRQWGRFRSDSRSHSES